MPAVAIGPTDVPALALAKAPAHPSPDDPLVAVHPVALVVAHERVVDWPVRMAAGDAPNAVIAAAGVAAETVTGTDCGALGPPGPVHVSV